MVSAVSPVAVIGAGLIGVSWAALFSAVGGHEVRVWDPSETVRADIAR
ncbi:3-hydroxyacyl-CoA dehydrogenase NAD-binding domain-containing protein, partial [Acinetobacter baumannii]